MYRLVDGDFGGNFSAAELVNPQPENIALHDGHPAHSPVLRGTGSVGIESIDLRHNARGQRFGPIQNPRLGTGKPGETAGDTRNRRRSLQLPGIEDLQRSGSALSLNPEHGELSTGRARRRYGA